jgi:hypothetical protein
VALPFPEALYEPLPVGDVLKPMPLFLDSDWDAKTPSEEIYLAPFRAMPAFWKDELNGAAHN